MRISELAKRCGVSTHRLRRYEALGMIRAERTSGNYREFSERTAREVTFIAMGRDLGFSLKDLAESLPRYRAGTLTIDEMVMTLQRRIGEVDALIAEQQDLRQRLVDHIGWFREREREAARRKKAVSRHTASTFPAVKRTPR